MTPLFTFLEHLSASRFYGEVVVKFEAGKPMIVRKTETLKPDDLQSVVDKMRKAGM